MNITDETGAPAGVAERLQRLRRTIAACERRYGRPAGGVELVVVTKQQPVAAVAEAHAAGQRAFAENYLQEARPKIEALAGRGIRWHFIGALQSNKTAEVAARFEWVHSVDRPKIARRLSAQRPEGLAPLNVCVEVNISGEAAKSGVRPAELNPFLEEVAALPRLRLRGLMAMPAPQPDFERQREAFAELARLRAASPVPLDTLSMGTSGDYEAAIAEGSTLVRIGTAVFGPRRRG